VAVETDPGFVLAWFIKALNLVDAGDLRSAQAAISQAQTLDYRLPASDRSTLKFLQYRLSGQQDKLIAFLRLQVQLKGDAQAHSRLANMLMATGQLDEAKQQFLEALDKDALNVGIYLQLSLLERGIGDMESAIGYARKYQEAKPEEFHAQLVLGDLLRDSGNLDGSEEHYAQASLLGDQPVLPLLRLADIATRKGDVNEAQSFLEQAELAALSVGHKAQVRGAVATLELRLGRVRSGIEQLYLLEKLMAEFQPPFQVALATYSPMVRAHNSLGDPDSAQEVLNIALDMVEPPLDQFLAFNEADILITLGDYDGAAAATLRGADIIEQFKLEDMKFLVDMIDGYIARKRGDYPGSSALFRAALERIKRSVIGGSEMYRQLPAMSAQLAESLILGGELDEAEKALAEGFRLDPSEPLLWLNKARFQFASGLPQLAQASVSYALAIWKDADPEFEELIEAQSLEQEIARSLAAGQ
jgi:tetratricopeptide (TPR) repeat protein